MNSPLCGSPMRKNKSSMVVGDESAGSFGRDFGGNALVPGFGIGPALKSVALAGALILVGGVAHASQPQKFLVFDRNINPAQIIAHPDEYVFVWGATNPALTKAFNKYSPKTLLSTYYPYSRDPDASHSVAFWTESHADWLAYDCDGKTPIKMYGDRNVALNITNPNVINWQVANFLKRPAGMEAVALDNFQFHNDGHACGVMSSAGKFVKRYGVGPHDAAFAEDAVRWLEKVSAELHAKQTKIVINHIPDLSDEGDDPGSPLVQRMVGAVDGILDEHAQTAVRDPRKAALLAKFVQYADAHGKWVYLLYQLGDLDAGAVESAMANYLTMAGPKTAIYVSQRDKTYGNEPDFLRFDKNVGNACAPAITSKGVVIRNYSRGLVIFSPAGQSGVTVPIPSGFVDIDGNNMGNSVRIAGGHGRVLYTSRADGCAGIQ